MTKFPLGRSITTSSFGPGTAPVLQLVGSSQKPSESFAQLTTEPAEAKPIALSGLRLAAKETTGRNVGAVCGMRYQDVDSAELPFTDGGLLAFRSVSVS